MTKLNLSYLLILALGMLLFSSCDKDDDNSDDACTNELLSGMIDGVDYTFQAGTASISGDDDISLDFYSSEEELLDNLCNMGFGSEDRIFGSLPNTTERIELMGIFSGGPTLTMIPGGTFNNIIISEGWVEFTSITETTIEGKMDIGSGESSACGTFTLMVCN